MCEKLQTRSYMIMFNNKQRVDCMQIFLAHFHKQNKCALKFSYEIQIGMPTFFFPKHLQYFHLHRLSQQIGIELINHTY